MVIASINVLDNLKFYRPSILRHSAHVIVVDEGDSAIRRKNASLFRDLDLEFYGPRERRDFFVSRFGVVGQKYARVIPERCHAETSFGFLVCAEHNPDMVVEVDDDTFPAGKDFLSTHWRNLLMSEKVVVGDIRSKWYNTLANLKLKNVLGECFPRGHPYDSAVRSPRYRVGSVTRQSVLHMGLWTGYPDLDAVTILYNGGLDGRGLIESKGVREPSIAVRKGTYFAICSMNTSFVPKIIPAFYQLYMNFLGIDRFDDIWSGIIMKKIADALDDGVSLGLPTVYHDKRPRSAFSDLQKEIGGMSINETLWKIVDECNISRHCGYWEAYRSIVESLSHRIKKSFKNPTERRFLALMLEKARLWLRVTDKLT
jgi:hypothetical protein